MHRRDFIAAGLAVITAACEQLASPTAPGSTVSLLTAVRNAGYGNAQSAAYGNGAAQIAIDGHTNWNFFVDGQLVGLSGNNSPTLNVPAIQIPSNTLLVVRHL